jgi:hypothetical protein
MIAHLDVDCFFAQVEEVRLSVRGRPLGVQQNMEIAAVNYEARAFGLYNRISVAEGKRLCPDLVLVRGDNGVNAMQRYRSAGQAVLTCVMHSLDPPGLPATSWLGRQVERSSFDDFFVQLPERLASVEAATAWAHELRAAVLQATGLRCSVGLARTKLLSMLATKHAKPNGMYCCVGAAPERALLDAARVDKICGAGLHGLRPSTRLGLQHVLGEAATLAQARAWLEEEAHGAAAALGAPEAEALGSLLSTACDGSAVGRFQLPRSLSVECSVRPTDHEPATRLEQVHHGFVHLAPMLLSRAEDDVATYGPRRPAQLLVKWKLFPSAKEVRQAQVAWPPAKNEDAHAIAALATRTFEAAVGTQPFRVSRLVLVLVYADSGASGSATGAAAKRKRAEPGQPSLLQFVRKAAPLGFVTSMPPLGFVTPTPPLGFVTPTAGPDRAAAAPSPPRVEAQQRAAERSSLATCPVCGASIPLSAINSHLDVCLAVAQRE